MKRFKMLLILIFFLLACEGTNNKIDGNNIKNDVTMFNSDESKVIQLPIRGKLEVVNNIPLLNSVNSKIDSLMKSIVFERKILESNEDTSYIFTEKKVFDSDYGWYPFIIQGELTPSLSVGFYLYGVYHSGDIPDYVFYLHEGETMIKMETFIVEERSIEIYGKEIDLFGLDDEKPTKTEQIYRYKY